MRMFQGSKNSRSLRGKVLDLNSGGWGAGAKRRQKWGKQGKRISWIKNYVAKV